MLILNGVSSIVRTWSIDPIYMNEKEEIDIFTVSYFLEDCCLYLAIWLFGAMVLETALDIEDLVLLDPDEHKNIDLRRTQQRRRKIFQISNIIVSVFIVLF